MPRWVFFPAIDPLKSSSFALSPHIVGQEHYDVAMAVKQLLQKYEDLKDMIAILGMEELSEADKEVAHRAKRIQRFLTQPMFTAAQFINIEGRFVPFQKTIEDVKTILTGQYDDLPEAAFYMVGTLEEVLAKAKELMT